MTVHSIDTLFPAGLVAWSGHHAGGVRRLFDDKSGRPSKHVLETGLLLKLNEWSKKYASQQEAPRIILLVGGPGNGKTESIESAIHSLDKALELNGSLLEKLRQKFMPVSGLAVPRNIVVELDGVARGRKLQVIQDASVSAGCAESSPHRLLIEELKELLAKDNDDLYLCCVNRGVLDDALIFARETGDSISEALLQQVTDAVSLKPNPVQCWPLIDAKDVAVWPMDYESLLVKPEETKTSPAEILFDRAIDAEKWLQEGGCEAGDRCPFCSSRKILGSGDRKQNILKILRWYELGSAKRLTFRDLFSFISYLLSGYRSSDEQDVGTPCGWAAKQIKLSDSAASEKTNKNKTTALFNLVASEYEQALFHIWKPEAATMLMKDIKELGMQSNQTLFGLYHFLHAKRSTYEPATIAPTLDTMGKLMDPALASPDLCVKLDAKRSVRLGDIDTEFSRSVQDGLLYVKKLDLLTPNAIHLLENLKEVDQLLSEPIVRRKKPATSTRVQRLLRDFSCKIVRRSIGVRTAAVKDLAVFTEYERVVDDKSQSKNSQFKIAHKVEDLLNKDSRFCVSLTTTFGQPVPPENRTIQLNAPAIRVQNNLSENINRPVSPVCFLMVSAGKESHPIALTFDLFKALQSLGEGMSEGSLPKPVVALLDTSKALLGGALVRDSAVLERATIRINFGEIEIGLNQEEFVSR